MTDADVVVRNQLVDLNTTTVQPVYRSRLDPPNFKVLPVSSQNPRYPLPQTKGGTTTIISPQTIGPTSALLTWNAIFPLVNYGGSGSYSGGGKAYVGEEVTVEWMSDAQISCIQTIGSNAQFQIYVDGSRIAPTSFSTDSSGSAYAMDVDFGDQGITRHWKIRGINFALRGIQIGQYDTLWAVNYPTSPEILFMGDSYTFGNGTSPSDVSQSYCNACATALGLGYLAEGAGQTGWNSTGDSAPQAKVTNCILLRSKVPNYVVTALGYNDQGGNQTTMVSNYLQSMALLRAGLPASSKIFTLGPWTPQGGSNNQANIAIVAANLQAAATSIGIPFIPIVGIFNSINYTGKFNSGDNVHPNTLGHQFLGGRIAELLFPLL